LQFAKSSAFRGLGGLGLEILAFPWMKTKWKRRLGQAALVNIINDHKCV